MQRLADGFAGWRARVGLRRANRQMRFHDRWRARAGTRWWQARLLWLAIAGLAVLAAVWL